MNAKNYNRNTKTLFFAQKSNVVFTKSLQLSDIVGHLIIKTLKSKTPEEKSSVPYKTQINNVVLKATYKTELLNTFSSSR